MSKSSRLEIRIDPITKEQLQLLANHLTESGTVTELLSDMINLALAKNKHLLNKPSIKDI